MNWKNRLERKAQIFNCTTSKYLTIKLGFGNPESFFCLCVFSVRVSEYQYDFGPRIQTKNETAFEVLLRLKT